MGKTVRASVLILLLACSARADWIPNGLTMPPPPPTAPAVQESADNATLNGEVGTPGVSDILTETALDLLALLPSLL